MNSQKIIGWENRPELSSLIAYCDKVIRPRLAALEAQRIATKRKRYLRTPVYLVLSVSAVLLFVKITGWNGILPQLIFLVCGTSVLHLFSGFYKLKKLAKSEIISDIFSNLGWGYLPEFEKSTDFYLLDRYGIFPAWDKKKYKDKITGKIDNIQFEAYETHLTHGSGDSEIKHDLFVIKVQSTLNFLGVTHIAKRRPKFDLNRFDLSRRSLEGLKRVKFVSSKFEKQFDVFSTDGVEAQYLLSPDRVEELMAFKRYLEGDDTSEIQMALGNFAEELSEIFTHGNLGNIQTTIRSITYFEGHIFFILAASDFFEIKNTQLDLSDPFHVDIILEEVDLIYQVFDHLKTWMRGTHH